jgi:O-antigen/teichoic acid export membrane protein
MSGGRTKRAAQGTATSILQLGAQIALQALLAPLVLRLSGQETLGAFAALMQVLTYLALSDLGFSAALNRYLAQAFGKDDGLVTFGRTLSVGRTFLVFTNCLLAVVALALSFYIASILHLSPTLAGQARLALRILAVWAVLRTPLLLYGAALTAAQRMAANNLMAIVGNVARLVFSIIAIYSSGVLVGLVLAYMAGEGIAFAMQRWWFRKVFPGVNVFWGIRDRTLFDEIFSFGLHALKINVATALAFYTDTFIVARLHGGAAASVFYTTQMPAIACCTVAWRATDNTLPGINEIIARSEWDRLRATYLRLSRYALFVAGPLAIGILGFNHAFIRLWVGEGQYAGTVMTVALAVFVFSTILNHLHGGVLTAFGDIRWLANFSLYFGTGYVVIAFVAGHFIGIAGVAVASAIREGLAVLIMLRRTMTKLGVAPRTMWKEAQAPALLGTAVLVPVVVISVFDAHAPWFRASLWAGIFTLCWACWAIAFGLQQDDRNRLRLVLRRSTPEPERAASTLQERGVSEPLVTPIGQATRSIEPQMPRNPPEA